MLYLYTQQSNNCKQIVPVVETEEHLTRLNENKYEGNQVCEEDSHLNQVCDDF